MDALPPYLAFHVSRENFNYFNELLLETLQVAASRRKTAPNFDKETDEKYNVLGVRAALLQGIVEALRSRTAESGREYVKATGGESTPEGLALLESLGILEQGGGRIT